MENIESVYLFGLHHGYGPGCGLALYLDAEFVATAFGELLGIVEQWVAVAFGQYDGSSHHGTRQGSASGLVASGL
jgi:hypothetical protein